MRKKCHHYYLRLPYFLLSHLNRERKRKERKGKKRKGREIKEKKGNERKGRENKGKRLQESRSGLFVLLFLIYLYKIINVIYY